jgi:hypothetical protein
MLFHLPGESMSRYIDQSKANQALAAGQTHGDMRPGHGVIQEAKQEDIAKHAYGIYVKGGCVQGHCQENWILAEKELRTEACRP